jgi:hypothetical protein
MAYSTISLSLGVSLVALGLVTVPAATAAVYTNGGLSPGVMELMVYSCFSFLLTGMVLASRGILNLIDSFSARQEERSTSSWMAKLRFIIRDRSLRTLRLVSGVTYGVLLSVLAGILVFQPSQNFSTLYHVPIPSTTLVVCCGSIGQMPQLVVYLSNNVGIVVTPIALVLWFAVSWLVGISASAAVLAYRIRTVRGNSSLLTTFGSFLGIFSVCPLCAQGVLAALLGGSGIVLVALFTSYQGYFIVASIPLLVISPVWTARSLSKVSATTCSLPTVERQRRRD